MRNVHLLSLLLCASAAGCVTETISDRPGSPWNVSAQKGQSTELKGPPVVQQVPPQGPTPRSVLEPNQTAEGRLHDISGLLLQYYLTHQAYPSTLAEALKLDPSVPGIDPATNEPFVYVGSSSGLPSDRKVAVYSPKPNAKGNRWAILVRPKMGQTSPAAWVVELTEIQLQGYLQAPVAGPETRPASPG